jgi:hypothetical protein
MRSSYQRKQLRRSVLNGKVVGVVANGSEWCGFDFDREQEKTSSLWAMATLKTTCINKQLVNLVNRLHYQ